MIQDTLIQQGGFPLKSEPTGRQEEESGIRTVYGVRCSLLEERAAASVVDKQLLLKNLVVCQWLCSQLCTDWCCLTLEACRYRHYTDKFIKLGIWACAPALMNYFLLHPPPPLT